MSDADYISLSKRQGETHPSAKETEYYFYDVYYEGEYEDYVIYSNAIYTLIHSNDPEKTDAWLRSAFPNLEESDDSARKKLISPTDVYESIVESGAEEITADLIAMAIIIAITSVCMYFIMHASVMNRIKEIGIYRAIGVSKKNLIFKFFIEAALLTVLTVLVGYILSSIFLGVITNGTSLIADIFYYPVWLALAVLGTVCSVTLFFGTLPIILLLRKTPSQILAKYDI